MKTLCLFTLLSLISQCFNKSPSQEKPEKHTLSITNRSIDFTGRVDKYCDDSGENYIYKLYFYAEITGFNRDEFFKLYVDKPEYGYMSCTIKYSTIYIECEIDVYKYYHEYSRIELKDVFPTIPDCQVSNWEKVHKTFYLSEEKCVPNCHINFKVSSITDPVSESSCKNTIQMTGDLRHSWGSGKFLSEYNFLLPAIVDDTETNLECTIKLQDDKNARILSCTFYGFYTLTFFPTIIYYPETKSHIKFYISKNFKLNRCYSPASTIRFLDVNFQCNTDLNVLNVTFNSVIFGFYQERYFKIKLEYYYYYAYLECHIPKIIITSTGNFIECILDIEKFPLFEDREIILPETFPDLNCRIENWNTINKKINIGVCYPNLFGEVKPDYPVPFHCAKDDFSGFQIEFDYDFKSSQFYNSFLLSVLIDGKNDLIPCELFKGIVKESFYIMYCYTNKATEMLTLFPTIITLDNNKKVAIKFDRGSSIDLQKCSVTEKTIYFNAIDIYCDYSFDFRQYYAYIKLYAKLSKFATDYSFKLLMLNPSNSYAECTIPKSKDGIEEITYIDCKLDILKYPLDEYFILPLWLRLDDIQIDNYFLLMSQNYETKGCYPENFLSFYITYFYIISECYKPHYHRLAYGTMSRHGNETFLSLEKSFSFQMNVIINGEYVLIPCELKKNRRRLIEYELVCNTNSIKNVTVYKTIIVDENTKQLIKFNGFKDSHQFLLEECNPSKYITFKSLTSECLANDNIFKISFYANIKGFSQEENIQIYLDNPSYIFMNCKIPKATEKETYIYCFIDIKMFPLNLYEKITLPNEFYIQPELEIINWENINKDIQIQKCYKPYEYKFDSINYLNTECYLNGNNSFIVEGVLKDHNNAVINDFNKLIISIDAYDYGQIKKIQCEIYPPDISNKNSRIFCNTKVIRFVETFPTIAFDETIKGNIFVNMKHIYDKIMACFYHDKMIFFKGVKSECLKNESSLKLLLYSNTKGFDEETKFNISLFYPNISYMECLIPKSNYTTDIECNLNISKFPLILKETIQLNMTSVNISNCFLSNLLSINKTLITGKCNPNYSSVFSIYKALTTNCYDKDYNVITFTGSFDNYENKKKSLLLNAVINGNLDTLSCEIYPPDDSYPSHRMFCYTNKYNKVRIFQTMGKDINSKENILIKTPDINVYLINCNDVNKIIFFKGINIKKENNNNINISFFGKINGESQKEEFLLYLREPIFGSATCIFPESKKSPNDIYIICILDTQKFPLIKTDKIMLNEFFPSIQGYSISNLNFTKEKCLYTGNVYKDYKLTFLAKEYIEAECYNKGINFFSAIGSLTNDVGSEKLKFYEFDIYSLQDIDYAFISCKLYSINDKYPTYQMDCYSTGILNAALFPTIVQDKNTSEFIFVDSLNEFSLNKCEEEIKRKIIFYPEIEPGLYCSNYASDNGKIDFEIHFYAHITGFYKEETFTMNIYSPSNCYLICTIPKSISITDIHEYIGITCVLEGRKFPFSSDDKIDLRNSYPNVKDCEILDWDKIPKSFDVASCFENYDLAFGNTINSYNKIYQTCKNKNEVILSIIRTLTYKSGLRVYSDDIYQFNLSAKFEKNTYGETPCELYFYNDTEINNYIMECTLTSGTVVEYFPTLVQDKKSRNTILIEDYTDSRHKIQQCSQYSKFIHFLGSLYTYKNYRDSKLEISFYSENIGLQKEENFKLVLEYPANFYLDCIIPSSSSGKFIECVLDINKFGLISKDKIILPSKLEIQGYSITQWGKVKKELNDIYWNSNFYSAIFYVDSEQYILPECDNEGNNVISIKGTFDYIPNYKEYNFDMLGYVDNKYSYLHCSIEVKETNNSIMCKVKGKSTVKIIQSTGIDKNTNKRILIKITDDKEFTLNEDCIMRASSSSSSYLLLFRIFKLFLLVFILF